MIEIPRALARQFRAVLRRSVVEQEPKGEWPLLLCRADARGLWLQAQRGGVALCYREPGKRQEAMLAFRSSVLEEFEGRGADPVTLEATEPGKGRASWRDGDVPRVFDFDTVTPDSIPSLPPWPREWTAMLPSFVAALDEAVRTTARESVRFALARLQLRGKTGDVVATDGRQLLVQGGFPLPWSDSLLVPRLSAFGSRELSGEQEIAVGRTKTHVGLRLGCWSFLLAIDATSRFPGVSTVIPDPNATTCRLRIDGDDAESLLNALPRLPGRDDDHSPVTLDLNTPVTVRAQSESQSKPAEVVLSRSTAMGPPTLLCTDRTYLARALRLGFRDIEVSSPTKPLVCRDGRRSYVWVPLDVPTPIPPSADPMGPKSEEGGTVRPTTTERRRPPMPEPPKNGHENGRAEATTDQSEPERWGIEQVIAETETLRGLLHDASARTARVLAALKHQRRKTRAVHQAMQSLRQLHLDR